MTPDEHLAEAGQLLKKLTAWDAPTQLARATAARAHIDLANALSNQLDVARLSRDVQHLQGVLDEIRRTLAQLQKAGEAPARVKKPPASKVWGPAIIPPPGRGAPPTGHVPTNEVVAYPGDDDSRNE